MPMAHFVNTELDYINLADVARISEEYRHQRPQFRLFDREGKCLGVAHRDPLDHVIQLIPAPAGLTLLRPINRDSYDSEPVAALGLTVRGEIEPIASSLGRSSESAGEWALQYSADGPVVAPFLGIYPDPVAWLSALAKMSGGVG